jgi:hypothetical protein
MVKVAAYGRTVMLDPVDDSVMGLHTSHDRIVDGALFVAALIAAFLLWGTTVEAAEPLSPSEGSSHWLMLEPGFSSLSRCGGAADGPSRSRSSARWSASSLQRQLRRRSCCSGRSPLADRCGPHWC